MFWTLSTHRSKGDTMLSNISALVFFPLALFFARLFPTCYRKGSKQFCSLTFLAMFLPQNEKFLQKKKGEKKNISK